MLYAKMLLTTQWLQHREGHCQAARLQKLRGRVPLMTSPEDARRAATSALVLVLVLVSMPTMVSVMCLSTARVATM